MSKYFLTITQAFYVTLMLALVSFAAANSTNAIQLTSLVELEVVVQDDQGKESVKRIPAEKVTPGSEIIYTTRFKHNGNQPAADIVISNPIPEHTVYKIDSATGNNTKAMFSVDGGQSFHFQDQLKVIDENGVARMAEEKDYTDIRWTYQGDFNPGEEGEVEFRVVLK